MHRSHISLILQAAFVILTLAFGLYVWAALILNAIAWAYNAVP